MNKCLGKGVTTDTSEKENVCTKGVPSEGVGSRRIYVSMNNVFYREQC